MRDGLAARRRAGYSQSDVVFPATMFFYRSGTRPQKGIAREAL